MAGTHGVTETVGAEIIQLVAGELREQKPVTVISGAGALVRGTVLGLIEKALGTPAAGAGNTGNGTIGSVALKEKAQIGDYILTCKVAAGNAGTFHVTAPDGTRLNNVEVGDAFSSAQIDFTIADGSVDFIVGDYFTVPVEVGSLKYEQLDLTGVTGTREARSILLEDADASAADVVAGAYCLGKFRLSDLVWPAGITDAQKNAALLQLQDRGIIVDQDFI